MPLTQIELYEEGSQYTGNALLVISYEQEPPFKRATVCTKGQCTLDNSVQTFTIVILPTELPPHLTGYLSSSQHLVEQQASGPLQEVLDLATSSISAKLPSLQAPNSDYRVNKFQFDLTKEVLVPVYPEPKPVTKATLSSGSVVYYFRAIASVAGVSIAFLLLASIRHLIMRRS